MFSKFGFWASRWKKLRQRLLLSSIQTGWPTKYPFLKWYRWMFYKDFFFPQSPTRILPNLTEEHGRCQVRNKNYIPIVSTCVYPIFCWCCSYFLVVFCFVFLFVLCPWIVHSGLPPMLTVSLDCSFWIASSVLFNVYSKCILWKGPWYPNNEMKIGKKD